MLEISTEKNPKSILVCTNIYQVFCLRWLPHPHPLPICPVLIAAVGIREISSTEESESKIVSKCTALNSYLQHVENYSLPIQQGEKVKVMKTFFFFIYTQNMSWFSVRRAAKQWRLTLLKCLKACCQVNLNTEWKRSKSWRNLKYLRKWNFIRLLMLTSVGKLLFSKPNWIWFGKVCQ